MIETERTIKSTGQTERQIRYYISSLKRAGYAVENFSTVTKIVLNILKQKDDRKGAKRLSIKTKRFKCNISTDYLADVLKKIYNAFAMSITKTSRFFAGCFCYIKNVSPGRACVESFLFFNNA